MIEHLLYARHDGCSKSVSIATCTFGVHILAHRGSVKVPRTLRKETKKDPEHWELGDRQGPFSADVPGFLATLAAP